MQAQVSLMPRPLSERGLGMRLGPTRTLPSTKLSDILEHTGLMETLNTCREDGHVWAKYLNRYRDFGIDYILQRC